MSASTHNKDGGSFADPSFQRLLTCLEQIRHKLDSREDEFLFLSNYFQSKDFWKAFKVDSSSSRSDDGRSGAAKDCGTPGAVTGGRAMELAQEVVETLLPSSLVNTDVQELQHILTKPHLKGLLQAHDLIAAGEFTSSMPEEEKGSEKLLIKLNDTQEKVENGSITPERNFEKEEVDNTNGSHNDDGGNDNGDEDGDNDNDDGSSGGDQAEASDKDGQGELKESSCESASESDPPLPSPSHSSHSSPSLPGNKHIMAANVEVVVTDTDEENINEETPWWDSSATDEKETTLQASSVNHHRDAREVQGAAKAVKFAFDVSNDIKEEITTDVQDGHMVNGMKNDIKETDIEEERREKVTEDASKGSDVEDGQKAGVPMVVVAENSPKTVRLFRNAKETLGITVKMVKNGEHSERIVVARILSGGLADAFGTLHVDDEILEINGRQVEGMTANEVAETMDGITGSVDIKIIPLSKDRKLTRKTKVSLRAFFDYNPLQDPLIPCKEVGVAFCTSDVLHVVNMDDAKWWQARKDGSSHDKAGLIPSKDFQEKRQQLNKIATSSDVSLQKDKNGRRALPFWKKRTNDSNKVLCNFLQDAKVDGWPAYEPVAKYLETSQKKRLLLLIGAPGVGRNELKKMLLSNSPDKFVTTVPHTSRHMKSYETDGKEYFFVSRQTMENFIQKRKFIEFGEFKGCLYGTSKDSIKRALKTGKTCVLKVLPEVMLLLRTAEFKPFCIYVKPPPLKELRSSRLTVQGKAKPASQKSYMRTFKEEDLQEMINAARELEDNYGKFFDLTVVNKDIEDACNSILEAIERLEHEEQWVPRDWVQNT